DLQPGVPDRRDVDVETDLPVFHAEADLPAARREALGLSDRQDRAPLERLEDAREMLAFRRADEENLALPGILEALKSLDDQPPGVDRLALHGLIEALPERHVPEDAADEGVTASPDRD